MNKNNQYLFSMSDVARATDTSPITIRHLIVDGLVNAPTITTDVFSKPKYSHADFNKAVKQVENIKAKQAELKSIADLGRDLGIHKSTLHSWINFHKVPAPSTPYAGNRKCGYAPDEYEAVVKFIKENLL